MTAKIPTMDDASLAVLHGNAERLQQSGTAAQKSAASALMPAIEAELASRRDAKLSRAKQAAALAPKRASKRKAL
jgi:hypothetical protein